MRIRVALPVVFLLLTTLEAGAQAPASATANSSSTSDARTPVLVELFTSEGCSTCPPADALLEKMDSQPLAGLELVVLSEHVDYWNQIGWTDPFSSHSYSERQVEYAHSFHLASPYTPEMVVDGTSQFVGSDGKAAQQALEKEKSTQKVGLRFSNLHVENGVLHAHIDTDSVPAPARKVDVILVVALNHAESQVARGENAGHHLTHVSVVRTLERVGTVKGGAAFSKDVAVHLEHGAEPGNLRVIGFLQESGQGRIWGAGEQKVTP